MPASPQVQGPLAPSDTVIDPVADPDDLADSPGIGKTPLEARAAKTYLGALLPEGSVPPLTSARKPGRLAPLAPSVGSLNGRLARLQHRWEGLQNQALMLQNIHWAPGRFPAAVVRVEQGVSPLSAAGLLVLQCR